MSKVIPLGAGTIFWWEGGNGGGGGSEKRESPDFRYLNWLEKIIGEGKRDFHP